VNRRRTPREVAGQSRLVLDSGSFLGETLDVILAARAWAYSVTVGVALVALWPGLDPTFEDSFPLSNYPMFARPRGKPFLYQMVGVRADDSQLVLGPKLIGAREVLQAKVLIQRAATSGKKAREAFCQEVATRVLRLTKSSPRYQGIERVEMLQVQFDPIEYFEKGPIPLSRKRLAQCAVTEAAR
jgi:hypothetical protein